MVSATATSDAVVHVRISTLQRGGVRTIGQVLAEVLPLYAIEDNVPAPTVARASVADRLHRDPSCASLGEHALIVDHRQVCSTSRRFSGRGDPSGAC